MRSDDVATCGCIGRIGGDGREGSGAVGVVQDLRRVGVVRCRADGAARVGDRGLGDREYVGGDEYVAACVVIDIRADANEVVVVPELGVVVE